MPEDEASRTWTFAAFAALEASPSEALRPMPQLRAGQSLGHYRLLRRLGGGGMGEVWQAHDDKLERDIALKVLLRQSRRGLARFAREAQVVAGLDHSHIAKLYDFLPEPPCLAMQLIDGKPISGAGSRSIRALCDAARAIHYAHQRGVLHRDVKPGNILVDGDGQAVVVDFGLARSLQEDKDASLTISGEILGTPAFMAPEQAHGDQRQVTVRTDVYGLGASLHALLRDGEPPFDGATAYDVLDAVIEDEPPLTYGNRDLETIAFKAMAKNPARRYATAEAFADDLERFLQNEPIEARRPGAFYRLGQSMRRRPTTWILAGALVLSLLIGGGISLWQLWQIGQQRDIALQRREALVTEQELRLEAERQVLANREAITASQERERQTEAERLQEQRRALTAEQQRARILEVQQVVERSRRLLRELEEQLSRRQDLLQQREVFDGLGALVAELRLRAEAWPEEGVIDYLIGEAHALRQEEQQALAAYDAALQKADTRFGEQIDLANLARLARARTRIRLRFIDSFVHVQLLGGGLAQELASDRMAVQEDLEAIAGDRLPPTDLAVMRLWSRFLSDIDDPSADLLADVEDEVAVGGRRGESVLVLRGLVQLVVADGAAAVLRRALADFDNALHRYHLQPQVLLLRALANYQLGRYAQGVIDATEAYEQRGTYTIAFLLRGLCLEAMGEARDAAADFDRLVSLWPHRPMAWYHRGGFANRRGEVLQAAEDFHQAIRYAQLAPHFSDYGVLWHAYGRLFAEVLLPEQAEAALRQAVEFGSLAALPSLIQVLERDGQHDVIERVFDEQLALAAGAQSRRELQLLLAQSRLRRGDPTAAVEVLDTLVQAQPREVVARILRGRALTRLRRFDGAEVDVDTALAWIAGERAGRHREGALPDDLRRLIAEVQMARLELYRGTDAQDAAWGAVAEAVDAALPAQLPAILAEQAAMHRARGNTALAVKKTERAAALWRQHIQGLLEVGDLAAAQAQIESARRALEQPRYGDDLLRRISDLRRAWHPRLLSLWGMGR